MWQFDTKTKNFIPGTLPADGSKISILYARLSQEDTTDGDSESIVNQREFLFKYALDHNFTNLRFISDDGYSGTDFKRPGFQEMMDYLEQGRVGTIIVKDHSGWGGTAL